jgi:hypothetical protein
MIKSFRLLLMVAFCGFYVQVALAGAPLKGIDVKLGKNPGGGCAARTTDEGGKANFGVWPKGNYTLSFESSASPNAGGQSARSTQNAVAKGATPVPSKLHVAITGAAGGKIERDVDAAASSAREAPVQFSLSGSEELLVVVTSAQ